RGSRRTPDPGCSGRSGSGTARTCRRPRVLRTDAGPRPQPGISTLGQVFATLSERLSETLSNLRGKGRLSDADIDTTAREIRIALLEADVALPGVRGFITGT